MSCCGTENKSGINERWQHLAARGLKSAAKLLKCGETELHILGLSAFPYMHLFSQFRDTPLKQVGITDKLPIIMLAARHGDGLPGYGLTLYACRDNANLHYVIYRNVGPMSDSFYIFVKQKQLAKVVRECKKQCRRTVGLNEPPILEDGLLDDILNSTIGFLKQEKVMRNYGVKINRGLLLTGPPGNGKTLCCRYIQRRCWENNLTCATVTTSQIDSSYKDGKLADLFKGSDVTFFDDIDIAYLNRNNNNLDGGKMACSMLTAMDGMDRSRRLQVRVFSTNEDVNALDEAFTRPGRIDRCINIPRPSLTVKRKLVASWPEEIRNSIPADDLIDRSKGFSCTDFEAVRVYLVTDFLFGSKKWDLDKALKIFEERKQDNQRMVHSGFAGLSGNKTEISDVKVAGLKG